MWRRKKANCRQRSDYIWTVIISWRGKKANCWLRSCYIWTIKMCKLFICFYLPSWHTKWYTILWSRQRELWMRWLTISQLCNWALVCGSGCPWNGRVTNSLFGKTVGKQIHICFGDQEVKGPWSTVTCDLVECEVLLSSRFRAWRQVWTSDAFPR